MQRRRERCAGVKRAVRGKGREGKGSERRGMEGVGYSYTETRDLQ